MKKSSLRYISYKGLDIAKKPSQYFNSYSLTTGVIKFNDNEYSIKKISLEGGLNPNDLPEVQLINSNYTSPYLMNYLDYIIEQEETNEGAWVNKAIYILGENSDFDLRTYLLKNGSLNATDIMKLCECLVGASYYLQKEMSMAHGDIRPQNVRIIIKDLPKENRKDVVFKLSYFDDLLNTKSSCSKKYENLAYMAPEILCSSIFTPSNSNEDVLYQPSQELSRLIMECPDEIRYDPYRADVFSAGLTLFSAATGILFSLKPESHSFGALRGGSNEELILSQNLAMLKKKYPCEGLPEILRIMLSSNPIMRYDFEELAFRINKIRNRCPKIPRIMLIKQEEILKKELEQSKEDIYELQRMLEESEKQKIEYKDTIESLRIELNKKQSFNTRGEERQTSTGDQGAANYILTDLSSINEDLTGFLDSVSTIKLMNNLERQVKPTNTPIGDLEEKDLNDKTQRVFTQFVSRSTPCGDSFIKVGY